MTLQLGAVRDALPSVGVPPEKTDKAGSRLVRQVSLMRVTASMIVRARRAFDHHNRLIGVGQLIPTSDDAIRAMLEAALADIPEIPPRQWRWRGAIFSLPPGH